MVSISHLAEQQRQVKELQRIGTEIEKIQQMKDPFQIHGRLNQIESQLSELTKRMDKSEKIQTHLLKQVTKLSQNSLLQHMDDMEDKIKNTIKTGMTELELDLMKTEFDFYKPDIVHLHKTNNQEASDTSEE